MQKRFVFLATFGANIQVFTDEWHELRRILSIEFPLYIFIDSCVNFITRHIFFTYTFEHSQKSEHCLVGKFLLVIEAALNLLDDGADLHNLCL